jgi:Zn-dependent oligopeptidase
VIDENPDIGLQEALAGVLILENDIVDIFDTEFWLYKFFQYQLELSKENLKEYIESELYKKLFDIFIEYQLFTLE